MRRVRDVSPAVRELAYSDDDRTLDVVWASGEDKTYRFFDVPPEVFEWLLNQPSKGGFIRRKIIGHYREIRIDTSEARKPPTDDADLLDKLEETVTAIGTKPPPTPEDPAD